MTMQVVSHAELPLDPADPSNGRTRRLRRTIIRIVVVLLVIAVPVVPFTWWQVSAQANVLQPWGQWAPGTSAAHLVAGNTGEYCYRATPGAIIDFGFAIANTGHHPVTLTGVEPVFGFANQQASVDRTTDMDHDSLAGRDNSPQQLPITLRPGQGRMLYLTIQLPADISLNDSHTYTDGVDLDIRTLGISRTEHIGFDFDTSPMWIGLSGPNDDGKYCDFNTPPSQ